MFRAIAISLILSCLSFSAEASSEPHHDYGFPAALETYPGGQNPVVGDYDGDGLPDVAATSFRGLDVYFSRADGHLALTSASPKRETTEVSFSADFNHDGKDDLIVSDRNADTLTLLLSNGDGSFQPQSFPLNGLYLYKVGTVDSTQEPFVFAFQNLSNGTLAAVILAYRSSSFATVGTLAINPYSVYPSASLLTDVTGDGNSDLVFGNVLCEGLGGGRFKAPRTLPFDRRVRAAADLDGDGRTDLVTSSDDGTNWSVAFQDSEDQWTIHDLGTIPANTVATGDFDGDGKVDLLFESDRIVLLQPGAGRGSVMKLTPFDILGTRGPMLVCDLDHDGRSDLIVFGTDVISVWRGKPSVSFSARTGFVFSNQTVSWAGYPDVATADFNHDGRADLVMTSWDTLSKSRISVFLSSENGGFIESFTSVFGSSKTSYEQPVIRDINGDGNLDILPSGELSEGALYGDGHGGFRPGEAPSIYDRFFWISEPVLDFFSQPPLSGKQYGIRADITGDGQPDLVLTPTENSFDSNGGWLLLSQPDGLFKPVKSNLFNEYPFIAIDLDGDHRVDLLNGNSAGLSFRKSRGDGTFEAPVTTITNSAASTPGDFDGDGNLDLLTTYHGPFDHSILFGSGEGRFDQVRVSEYLGGQPPSSTNDTYPAVAVADFDGDGRSDFAYAIGGSVFIVPSLPFHTGHTPVTFTLQGSASNISYGDFFTVTPTLTPSSASGGVSYLENGTTFGVQAIRPGISNQFNLGLTAGVHNITAIYTGDSIFDRATATIQVTVAKSHVKLSHLDTPYLYSSGTDTTVPLPFLAKTTTQSGNLFAPLGGTLKLEGRGAPVEASAQPNVTLFAPIELGINDFYLTYTGDDNLLGDTIAFREADGKPSALVAAQSILTVTPTADGFALSVELRGADGKPVPERHTVSLATTAALTAFNPSSSLTMPTDATGHANMTVSPDLPVRVCAFVEAAMIGECVAFGPPAGKRTRVANH